MSASLRPQASAEPPASTPVTRPPTYETYRPPRTTAAGGATMLVSGVFAALAVVMVLLAAYSKIWNTAVFGQIGNLLLLAIALLLMAVYLLVWEIAVRMIGRAEQ